MGQVHSSDECFTDRNEELVVPPPYYLLGAALWAGA